MGGGEQDKVLRLEIAIDMTKKHDMLSNWKDAVISNYVILSK